MNNLVVALPADLGKFSRQLLAELMGELGCLNAAVIATADGFEVAALARLGIEVAKLSALACSISALGAVVGDEGGVGAYQNVIIEAEQGFIVITDVPHDGCSLILCLMSAKEGTLGQIILGAKKTAKRLSEAY